MIPGQSNLLEALGWALLNSLWQMAFLWIIYQVITGIMRKISSSGKSTLATSLLMSGFAWFVYTFLSIAMAQGPENGAITSISFYEVSNVELNDWLRTMLPIASVIYIFLLALPLFNFIRNYRYVQVIRKFELSKADVDWKIFVKKTAARLGIKKSVHIWLSGLVSSPVTIGYFKPVILLPIAVVNHLSNEQVEAILLHELSHIRRFDYLLNLIIRFIQSVLYFNPFVKALVKIVEREREKSCDEIVMQFQYDPYGYANALLTLEKANHMPKSLAVAASGKKNDLLHRIECMLGIQKKQVFSFNKVAALFAGLLCFIVLNALLIATHPSDIHADNKTIASLTHLSSPFYIYTGKDDSKNERSKEEKQLASELPVASIVNNIRPTVEETKTQKELLQPTREKQQPIAFTVPQTYAPFINVAFAQSPAIPMLKEYQEEQVKTALEASRKVLEEKQWKYLENKIADVMTSVEKDKLKCEYDKEMKKVDWNKMEDKLRLAYNHIEWNKVNEELNKALVEIKIDSIQQAYSEAMAQLSELQVQLKENNLKGIPDSDITLKAVEQGKKEVEQALRTIISAKSKKTVHL